MSVHGGPTSQTIQEYEPKIQFFTSRGFAWLEVNHRGSTGYGKAYKDLLRGAWGVYDVEDAASGALTLVERGLADARMLVITGGSAGGYTVLQSLVSKPGLYAAGEMTGGFHGVAFMTGTSLGKCAICGRIAGRNAARDDGRMQEAQG